MNILAFYLPQFHSVYENDLWWGEGYTEWEAVKRAKPLYPGHVQPRIPCDDNYYDLAEESGSVWKWQTNLAKEYGVDGFCIYHYWFEGKKFLEKPAEILLSHGEIDFPYCFCWANESLTRAWYGKSEEILLKQTYGKEDEWREHYLYMRPFFLDKRYMKVNNKPILHIYRPFDIEKLKEMRTVWDEMAKADGFDGIYLVGGRIAAGCEMRQDCVDAQYVFEPGYTLKKGLSIPQNMSYYLRTGFTGFMNALFGTHKVEHRIDATMIYRQIERQSAEGAVYPGTFAQWDNTPRRGYRGLVYTNTSPRLFKEHLERLGSILEKDTFLYINAWNEWGEGAYLEPDEQSGLGYLQALREWKREWK